jgi:hypothetical protein
MVNNDQNRMRQRHQRAFLATPSGNPPILSGQIGLFGFGGDMRNLNQNLPEPDIAFAGLAAQALVPTFRIARAHPGPRSEVFGIGEALQGGPDLSDNDFCRFPTHPWDGIEEVNDCLFFLQAVPELSADALE